MFHNAPKVAKCWTGGKPSNKSRITFIAAIAGSRNVPVWCMIYDDLDYMQEADVFANQQKYVKRLEAYEVFKANVEAGNDEQLIIRDLVESHKLVLSPNNAAGCIAAVATVEHIYRLYGFHVLDRILCLCVGTWEGDADSLSMFMLRGVMRLVVAFGDSLQDNLFKEKVGRHSARFIGRTAKERKAGTHSYAEVMLDIYNQKLNAPLPRLRLYATAKPASPDESVPSGQ